MVLDELRRTCEQPWQSLNAARAPLFSAACLAAVAKVFFWHLADVDVGSEHVRPEG